LNKLKYLYLNNNRLSEVPTLKDLTVLESIYLNGNNIKTLPKMIGNTKVK